MDGQDEARIERAMRRASWLPDERVSTAHGWAFLREALTTKTARRWYVGAAFSLVFAVGFGIVPLILARGPLAASGYLVALIVYGVVFLASAPVSLALAPEWRWVMPVLLLLLSLIFVVPFGTTASGLWVYVAVAAAMASTGRRITTIAVLALGVAALALGILDPLQDTPPWTIPLVLVSVGVLMMMFSSNLQTLRLLRSTREELARVAVEEERGRVGRDMHDILGHSLSAIAVKADLAAALADRDPGAAAREIREVQALARTTLGDMRAVVSGYRTVRLASELASLRSLLPAAGITAHLPTSTDGVAEDDSEVFGWVVREAATNVIRHSGATACWVVLTPGGIRVEDDGRGPAASDSAGTGLESLRERVQASGRSLIVGRSHRGGFLVEVTA